MLGNRKVIVDSFCELNTFAKSFEDEQFHDLARQDIVSQAIYIISRQQFEKHRNLICHAIESQGIIPVFGNPAEGSETMVSQLHKLQLLDLVKSKKIAVISGGDMQGDVPHLLYEHFMSKILDFQENITAIEQYQHCWSDQRPYKFLFLNGRARPHRQQLLSVLSPLLDQALWSNLDATYGQALKYLPSKYEFDFYQHRVGLQHNGFAKYEFFNNDWGEVYINSITYQHTYFSLVTETVVEYPHSFRTEKIWKPVAMGHPFVVAANAGYYEDLHSMGFETFDNVIDESFDQIKDSQLRLEQIIKIVTQLCASNLCNFANDTRERCEHNRQHFEKMSALVKAELPLRLETYLKKFINE